MRKLTISVFKNARATSATRHEISFEEFCEDLAEPEWVEGEPSEPAAAALKLDAPAWSPSAFRDNKRLDDNVTTVALLAFDLDGEKKEGVALEPVRKFARSLGVSYALHSTTRSGLCPVGQEKLRLIFPLERDLAVSDYLALWDDLVKQLPTPPDSTRRHPGGLFFAPRIFLAHKDRYVYEGVFDKPYLDLPTFKPNLNVQPEEHWLENVRNAANKHVALNQAAFALSAQRTREHRSLEGLEDALIQALHANHERGASPPVQDWEAARHTIDKALREGREEAESELEEDPLSQARETFVTPKLQKTALTVLEKMVRRVKQGADVQEAARELGRYVPHALEADKARKALVSAWKDCKNTALNVLEAESQIDLGLGAGMAAPIGVWDAWRKQLQPNQDGTGFSGNMANVHRLVKHHPELHELVGYDIRAGLRVFLRKPPWSEKDAAYPLFINDADEAEFSPWVSDELGSSQVDCRGAFRALLLKADGEPFDPLLQYFGALPRADSYDLLERFLIDGAGAADTPYTRLVTRLWLTSVYARQIQPGAKVDHALILSGFQGAGKSSIFEQLFPEALAPFVFTASLTNWEDKDCVISLSRLAIVELGELAQMSRRSIEVVKSFLTERWASRRPSYGTNDQLYLRRAVFVGTTNENNDFLIDTTGNRRFWPVKVGQIDNAWVREHRDTIWAQARYAYETTGCWWPRTEEEKELCREAQDAVTARDSLYEDLQEILAAPISPKYFRTSANTAGAFSAGESKIQLEPEQGKIGGELSYITTKQLAGFFELDYKDWKVGLRFKKSLEQLGWREERDRVGGRLARRWRKV